MAQSNPLLPNNLSESVQADEDTGSIPNATSPSKSLVSTAAPISSGSTRSLPLKDNNNSNMEGRDCSLHASATVVLLPSIAEERNNYLGTGFTHLPYHQSFAEQHRNPFTLANDFASHSADNSQVRNALKL